MKTDQKLLASLAIRGLESERSSLRAKLDELDVQEKELKSILGRRGPGRPAGGAAKAAKPKAKRHLSAAARTKLSKAMKKRWAQRRTAQDEAK